MACILPRSITRTVSTRAPHQCAGLWNHACHLGQVSKHVLPCGNKNVSRRVPARSNESLHTHTFANSVGSLTTAILEKNAGPGRSPYRITLQTHVSVIKPKCQGLTNGAGPCEAFTPKQVSLQCPRCRMYLAIYVTAKCERTESEMVDLGLCRADSQPRWKCATGLPCGTLTTPFICHQE